MDLVVLIKVFSAVIYPLGVVVVLWLLSYLVGVFDLSWSMTALLISSNPICATWLASSLERQHPQTPIDDIADHDVIIVLVGGLRLPIPPAQHVQIGSGADRYWYAARLYHADKGQRIVLLGGNVFEQTGLHGEAYYARELLQQWGVPHEAIIIETESRTTVQHQQNFSALLKEQKINSALLVTSALHMPRSYELFRQLPILVTPASADVLVREQNAPAIFSWLPSAVALSLTTVSLHEYYARAFNRLKRFLVALKL